MEEYLQTLSQHYFACFSLQLSLKFQTFMRTLVCLQPKHRLI